MEQYRNVYKPNFGMDLKKSEKRDMFEHKNVGPKILTNRNLNQNYSYFSIMVSKSEYFNVTVTFDFFVFLVNIRNGQRKLYL